MKVILTSREELLEVFKEAFKEALLEIEQSRPQTYELFTKKEAMKLLRTGFKKLNGLIQSGQLTVTPDGKKIFKNSILNYLKLYSK
jgi:hypothetical protein